MAIERLYYLHLMKIHFILGCKKGIDIKRLCVYFEFLMSHARGEK